MSKDALHRNALTPIPLPSPAGGGPSSPPNSMLPPSPQILSRLSRSTGTLAVPSVTKLGTSPPQLNSMKIMKTSVIFLKTYPIFSQKPLLYEERANHKTNIYYKINKLPLQTYFSHLKRHNHTDPHIQPAPLELQNPKTGAVY